MSAPFNNLFDGGIIHVDPEERSMSVLPRRLVAHHQRNAKYIPRVHVKFKAVGHIPELPQKNNRIRVRMDKSINAVEPYLKNHLQSIHGYGGPIYLYIQDSFRPEPESLIYDLFHNYSVDGTLEVSYTREPLWG